MRRIALPVRILSAANLREHWATKRRRDAIALRAIVPCLNVVARELGSTCPLPVVTFTRIGPRDLDKHDNLRHAFKFVADAVAKAFGEDDSMMTFRYDQRRAIPGDEVVRGFGLVITFQAEGKVI